MFPGPSTVVTALEYYVGTRYSQEVVSIFSIFVDVPAYTESRFFFCFLVEKFSPSVGGCPGDEEVLEASGVGFRLSCLKGRCIKF